MSLPDPLSSLAGTLPPVTILMATREGAAHLQAQLDSIAAQTHRDWALWISDDGSRDATRAIVKGFADRHGADHDIRLLDGPGQGAAANFLSLLCHRDLPSGFVALSDQDDVWFPGKLARALAHLEPCDPAQPVVYTCRAIHTDADLRPLRISRSYRRPCFGNALVQNVVSGYAAVMTPGMLALVRRVGPVDVPFHDWWLYLLASGAGGRVVMDDEPMLHYRQHGANVLGASGGAMAGLRRIRAVFGRQYGAWLGANLAALTQAAPHLNDKARNALARLAPPAPRAGPGRAAAFAFARAHRQSPAATLALYVAAALGRV